MKLFRLTEFRVALLAILGMILLYLGAAQIPLFRNLEAKTLDLRFQLRGASVPKAPIALVLVDDKSIRELGRWPWGRERFAQLVRKLRAAGARVIAFDMLFLDPDKNLTRKTLRSVRRSLKSILPEDAASRLLRRRLLAMERAADPDGKFAAAISGAGNVLIPFSFVFPFSGETPGSKTKAPDFVARSAYRLFRLPESGPPKTSLAANRILAPIALLGRAARAAAHVNVAYDTDGTPRFDYPVISFGGAYFPSLSVQAVRMYLGLAAEEMRVVFGEGVQIGDFFLPTDDSMRMLVNYYGPEKTFPSYSFSDVVQGKVPASAFRGKIIFVGGQALGLADTFVTPYTTSLLGVERHAHIAANILRRDFLVRHRAAMLLDLLAMALLGLFVGFVGLKVRGLWGSIIALALAAAYAAFNFFLFARGGLWLHLLFPVMTVAAVQGTVVVYQYITQERQKRAIRRAFQYYLHPALVDQVTENPALLRLGGEEKELTVLFSDIRNFSRISESMRAESLVELLNEYHTAMTRIVLDENGLLDKYIGDAIMAIFGAPLPLPEHALHACRCALRMMEKLKDLQAGWEEQGIPGIDIGIGISTAPMVAGNMGSELRFDYTVMGDGVNLGSRLEGANKLYGTHILISEVTWESVRDEGVAREIDLVRVVGKQEPVRIFEFCGLLADSPDWDGARKEFESGLRAYRGREWEEAAVSFRRALDARPDDKCSRLYLERCEAFQKTPPPPEWDGVFEMTSK